jgi:hypothetical protein
MLVAAKPKTVAAKPPPPSFSAGWVAAVHRAAPETIPTIGLFLYGVASAALQQSSVYGIDRSALPRSLVLPIVIGLTASVVATHPRNVALVDSLVPADVVRWVCGTCHEFECLGLALLGFGSLQQSSAMGWLMIAVGVCIASNMTQTFRIHRKTTGISAIDWTHKALLVVKTHQHHYGSFLILPNAETALFVTCWCVL